MKYFSINKEYKEANLIELIDENTGEIVDMKLDDFNENYSKCYDCGYYFNKDDLYCVDEGGEYYCNDCLEEEFDWCPHCEEYHCRNDFTTVKVSWNRYEDWCSGCVEEDTFTCNDCGQTFKTPYYDYYYGDDGCIYCEDCIDYHNGSDIINSYHTFKENEIPTFLKLKDETDPLYMGFELEIDKGIHKGDAAHEVVETLGDYIRLEEDGSLNEEGFEMITQPCTLSYHLEKMMPKWEEVIKALRNYDYTSHNAGTCGLHIHLDKEFFGGKLDSSTAKLLLIFNKYWNELLKFSRRTENQVSNWAERYYQKPTDTIKAAKSCNVNRYHAVNLTNENTIEIRLWRGTLNLATLKATLKFTDRLARLCKDTPTTQLWKMSWQEILGDDEEILAYWETVKNRNI